jgi:hypothetical protein
MTQSRRRNYAKNPSVGSRRAGCVKVGVWLMGIPANIPGQKAAFIYLRREITFICTATLSLVPSREYLRTVHQKAAFSSNCLSRYRLA